MSWFSKNKKTDVHRTLARILNSTVSVKSHMPIDPAADQRIDSRITRTTPVIVLPLDQEGEESQLTIGLTLDVSCEGMALATLGTLPKDCRLAVGLGRDDDFSVLLCECVRSVPIGFGYFSSGVLVVEVLPVNDFVALKEFAQYLEANPPVSSLSLVTS